MGGGHRKFITTNTDGGLIGRRRTGGGGGVRCDWSSRFSLGETDLLCKGSQNGCFVR